MEKKTKLQRLQEALADLIEATPIPEDDPWDEKTVDIRPDIEAGEAKRVADQPGLPPEAHEQSSLVKLWDSQRWGQVLITSPRGYYVIDMGEKGPVVQSLQVSREGRPYTLSDLHELLAFEKEFELDQTPFPGNIIISKKKVV